MKKLIKNQKPYIRVLSKEQYDAVNSLFLALLQWQDDEIQIQLAQMTCQ